MREGDPCNASHPRPGPSSAHPSRDEDFALVTWTLPPARLRDIVPPAFDLETISAESDDCAYLSSFPGRKVIKRFGALPAFPLCIHQLNYRTYLRTPLGSAVYIFVRASAEKPWRPGYTCFRASPPFRASSGLRSAMPAA
ncbi:MAG: DUF2071 domain-containing protein [Candidatus Sericytochromatia bacterium]|uniref:DUF2071 domain-containing protein n=1 Tax=Candidatus Tanganyikabacteria bacterium TaxID=2961651 RepID=A0A938BKI3_9BACT|nr:DUF2071 domain-containing protein [Candidatus Tanganyikabacteria bacterium]